jgi:hypothetical protein
MTTSLSHAVLCILARHADRTLPSLSYDSDLERDLDLSPLELVFVSKDLGDACELDLTLDGIERVKTVGELVAFLLRAVSAARHATAARARARRFGRGSGAHALEARPRAA